MQMGLHIQGRRALSDNLTQWQQALWGRNSVEPSMLRVPLVVIFFVGLWALNLWIFERYRVQYSSVLGLTGSPLQFTTVATMVLAIGYTSHMQICTNFLSMNVEMAISWFYVFVGLLFFILPAVWSNNKSPRVSASGVEMESMHISNTDAGDEGGQFIFGAAVKVFIKQRSRSMRIIRTVLFPGSTVSFTEVLFADALCSLSKVFRDFGVTLVALYAYFSGVPPVEYHVPGMLLAALLASTPSIIRVRQCWVQYTGSTDSVAKLLIALNILKYCTSFPAIGLAAASSLGYGQNHPDLPYWTAAACAINSVMSYLWDIAMDWGLLQFSMSQRGRVCACLRPRSIFFYPWPAYVFAVVINLVLRFAWLSNHVEALRGMHATQLVLLIEIAEVVRRAIWNVFRVEWELISKTLKERSLSKGDDEGLALVPDSNNTAKFPYKVSQDSPSRGSRANASDDDLQIAN
jgi:hypothetical protein